MLQNTGVAEYRERRSVFAAQAHRVDTAEEAADIIASVRRRFHNARHHPFAWVIGRGDQRLFRAYDDGEPSGSSGPPILARIDGEDLIKTLVVVTRYYGGVKLGVGNLARAYGQSAQMAIEDAGKKPDISVCRMAARCRFEHIGVVVGLIRQSGARVVFTGADSGYSASGLGGIPGKLHNDVLPEGRSGHASGALIIAEGTDEVMHMLESSLAASGRASCSIETMTQCCDKVDI